MHLISTSHLGGTAHDRLNTTGSALHEVVFSEPPAGTGANANLASTEVIYFRCALRMRVEVEQVDRPCGVRLWLE